MPGAGAAGGLGYAFVQFVKGKLEPGAARIMDAIGLEAERLASLVRAAQKRGMLLADGE